MPFAESATVDIVRRFRGLRALVIGDAMLDTYIEGVATRLCKEGPVPVLEKAGEHSAPGGAANSAANLRALGAEVMFVALVGPDRTADDLRSALRASDVDDRWLVEDEACGTIRKTRVLANGQYVIRFDEGETRSCSPAGQRRLLERIDEAFPRCDLVVVPDYGYGAASNAAVAHVRKLRESRPVTLAVDAKHPRRFAGAAATVITPNFNEAWSAIEPGALPPQSPGADEAERLGRRLLEAIDAELAAVTLAGDGLVLLDR
ncbi:MAG: bifunctional heptose 7-phosphate kinase/heptose 1-phosphate adenyltransferase, partial [Thermomicrobiales bacterium]